MKKNIFVLTALLSLSFSAQAFVDHCSSYAARAPRFLKAIEVVAQEHELSLEQLCQSEKYIGIEAQPSRKVTRDGEVIPHVSVQLHMYSSSCLYMVRDADWTVTGGRCYSAE